MKKARQSLKWETFPQGRWGDSASVALSSGQTQFARCAPPVENLAFPALRRQGCRGRDEHSAWVQVPAVSSHPGGLWAAKVLQSWLTSVFSFAKQETR